MVWKVGIFFCNRIFGTLKLFPRNRKHWKSKYRSVAFKCWSGFDLSPSEPGESIIQRWGQRIFVGFPDVFGKEALAKKHQEVPRKSVVPTFGGLFLQAPMDFDQTQTSIWKPHAYLNSSAFCFEGTTLGFRKFVYRKKYQLFRSPKIRHDVHSFSFFCA